MNRAVRQALLPVVAVLLLSVVTASAQEVSRVGNRDIAAHVVTSPKQGRFWITGGSDYGDTLKFLYASGASFVTSNLVFRVSRNGSTNYYCNLPPTSAPSNKPINPINGQPVDYMPFDSSYVSRDTLAIVYKNMGGYWITVRFMPEKRQTQYDHGSDMLIEFDYRDSPFGSTGELGILMMLDTYNNNATSNSGGGTGDNASFVSSNGYFPSGNFGAKFAQPFDSIPYWYHVGNFKDVRPLNTLYPIHRLRDTSHGGRRLTTPNIVAFGSWLDFRSVGWNIPSNVGGQIFNDAASLVRWDQLQGEGKVVTAFGLNDKDGNNMFTCRDSSLFADIRAQRVVTQKVKGGPFTPDHIDVEMWLSNTEDRFPNNVSIELGMPILTTPASTGRITLDPSTPPRVGVQLPPRGTKKIYWRLNVAPGTPDTIEAQLRFYYIYDQKPTKTFREGCTPKITIRGFQDPPPPQDTIPPVINRLGSGRDTTAFARFKTFDRHPGYLYDTGLDRVDILPGSSNYNLYKSPLPLIQCNTAVDWSLEARVIDTTKAAKIVFRVYDCKGNYSVDSASYTPFPDIFTPRIESIDITRGVSVDCNARQYDVRLSDTVQRAAAGDAGFGLVEVVGVPDNFTFQLNYDNGGRPIAPFDKFASFRVKVVDTMKDGNITIHFADFAGNDSTLSFVYCTLPDVEPPHSVVTPDPTGKLWSVYISDSLAWDRGLYGVNVLANTGNNMNVNLSPIIPGAPGHTFTVNVVDDKQLGYIKLEVTDLKYLEDPVGHADTIELVFTQIPDTLAPNIRFANVVDPTRIIYDVLVDYIHDTRTALYRYALGLRNVRTLLVSSNIRLVTPISFAVGAKTTSFQVEVIDTLAIAVADTLVVEATDVAGNVSVDTLFYPIKPDRLTPRFDGMLNASRTAITGVATDRQPYDRGLGSIILENPLNLDPTFSLTGLNGLKSTAVTIRVLDPEEPIGGTILFRDLIGDMDNTVESQSLHAARLTFHLPVAGIRMELPDMVEGGADIVAAVVATESFAGDEIRSLEFGLVGSSVATYLSATGVTVTPATASALTVRFDSDPTRVYAVGDTLGRVLFKSSSSTAVQKFNLGMSADPIITNGGIGTLVVAMKGADTVGTLALPAPYLKASADSLTWVNGTCERILQTRRGAAKSALEILGVRPQPVSTGGERWIEIDLRDLPEAGGVAELVNANGDRVASYPLSSPSSNLIRLRIDLPEGIASGVYFLRIVANTGTDAVRVMVVD
jgi:hypothetical protein